MSNEVVLLDGPPIGRSIVRANKEQVAILQDAYFRTSGQPDCDVLRQLHAETGLAEKWIVGWFRRFRKKNEKKEAQKEMQKETQVKDSAEDEEATVESKPSKSKSKRKTKKPLVTVKKEISDSVIPPEPQSESTSPPAAISDTSVKPCSPAQIVFPTSFNVTVLDHENSEYLASTQANKKTVQTRPPGSSVAPKLGARDSNVLSKDLVNIAIPSRVETTPEPHQSSQSPRKRPYPVTTFIQHTPFSPNAKRPRTTQTTIPDPVSVTRPIYPKLRSRKSLILENFASAVQPTPPCLPVSQTYAVAPSQIYASRTSNRIATPQFAQQAFYQDHIFQDMSSSGSRASIPPLYPPVNHPQSSSFDFLSGSLFDHSELSGDPFNPTLCPLKHLRVLDELQNPAPNECTVSITDSETMLDRLLDEQLVQTDPFQAAMGLVFLSRLGYQWS